jgi:outer membrane protein TolC
MRYARNDVAVLRTTNGRRDGGPLGALAAWVIVAMLAGHAPGVAQNAERQMSKPDRQIVRQARKPSPRPASDPGQRQGTTLSLADAVFMALRDNRAIKSAYVDRISQKFDLRVAEDRFTPHFAISGSVVRQTIGGFGLTNADIAPNAAVLLPTGATLGFAWNNSISDGGGIQTRTSTTDVTFTQPLLRGGGVDATLAPLRSARLGEKINRLNLKKTVSETIGQVILAYRALLRAQEESKLAQTSLARAKDLVDVNRAMIRAGRMAPVEIVQSEADVENQQIRVLQATKGLDDARLALLNLLALDLGTAILAGESTEPARIRPDLSSMMRIALDERPDYLGQLFIVEQNKLGIVVAENEKLWDLSVFATGSFGRQTVTGPPAVGRSQRISDTTVGLSINMPLNDLRRDQPAVQAGTTLKTSELQLATIRQGIELQVRSSVTEIDIQWKQLEAARRARELAARAVDIEKEKLKVGRSSNFQVRSLESDLRNAEEQQLSAMISYLNALTTLDIQIGTTLKTWRINLAD